MFTKIKDYFTTNLDIKKNILKFSGPLIAENMLMSLINVVNSSMVGHLGKVSLAAVGLTNQPVFIFTAVFQSFNVGATALIARFIGADEYDNAKNVVFQTLWVSTFLGLLLSVLGYIYAENLVLFMGAKPDTLESATMYMRYMSIGAFFQAIPLAIASILRGAGRSREPMVYNTVANIVNVIVGFVLIHGVAFFPQLGLEGAAIGATIAKFVGCVMSIIILFKSPEPINFSFKNKLSIDFTMVKRIMNISVSAALEQFVMRVGFLVYSKTIAELGTTELAAHMVINNITGLCSNVVQGFSIAASSYTGRMLGAGKPGYANKYVYEISMMGFIFSTFAGFCFLFLGYEIASVFTNDTDVILLAEKVLIIGAMLTFPQNIQQVMGGCLRGAGDTKWPLITSLVTITICRVGLAIVFVKYFHFGLFGAWMAALFDQSLRAVFMYVRYKREKWKTIQV